ncbi:MAG: pilus assembly protein PilM [Candidatus Magasanikbacteria bacterium]
MPLFWSKRAVGLDISDHTIEVVELQKKIRGVHVRSKARMSLKSGIVVNGEIKDEVKLTKALEILFSKAQPRWISKENIIIGLPESQVYTHVFRLKDIDKKHIQGALARAMERIIPLPPKDVWYNYTIERKDETVFEVLVVAVSRSVFRAWQAFFSHRGYKVSLFDIESLAVKRGLSLPEGDGAVCVADIGESTTHIGIHDALGLRHGYTFFSAGHEITEAMVEAEGISFEDAEKKKKLRGLKTKKKVSRDVIETSLLSILNSIVDASSFFQEQGLGKVSRIVLVGGSAQLPGLLGFFKKQSSIPVTLGKPLLFEESTLVYIEAVGLARRGLFLNEYQKDISFSEDNGFLLSRQLPSSKSSLIQSFEEKKPSERLRHAKKFVKKHIILLLVICIAIIAEIVGFVILDWALPEKEKQDISVEEYRFFEIVPVTIPVAVDEGEATEDRFQARLISITVGNESDTELAEQKAFSQAEQAVGEKEVLWKRSVRRDLSEKKFEFIIYDTEILATFAKTFVSSRISDEFLLQEATPLDLSKTENPNIFLARVQLSIAFKAPQKEIFSLKKEPEGYTKVETVDIVSSTGEIIDMTTSTVFSTEALEEEKESVIILETGVGYLNVRGGAGKTFPVITTVDVGETFEKIGENDDGSWIQLQVTEDQVGWVSSEYISSIQ